MPAWPPLHLSGGLRSLRKRATLASPRLNMEATTMPTKTSRRAVLGGIAAPSWAWQSCRTIRRAPRQSEQNSSPSKPIHTQCRVGVMVW